ncbi:hypothetical protein TIFTF001_026548 [Ficus carica]|uniref:Inactive shikimate kinase like 1, chloroplastic n=1 Tax=Ficus carica TaxID=3494 RepID=A0AA88DLC5_FICCA|nr:hypothetical protein TIFTF001_026548 [Ficus carica]
MSLDKLLEEIRVGQSRANPVKERRTAKTFSSFHGDNNNNNNKVPNSHSFVSPFEDFPISPTYPHHISLPIPIPKTSSHHTLCLLRRRWDFFFFDFKCSVLIQNKAADISPGLKGTSIFLVGMDSSIKTSLGKLLAETLRYYYFDSDSLVEEAAGAKSTVKSFKETDEQGFRESESVSMVWRENQRSISDILVQTEVLKQLSSMGRLVVCAGIGAVQSSTNLALLRHGISVWIDVPLDMVASGILEEHQSEREQVMAHLGSLYEESRDGCATADATVSLQNVACQLGYDDLNAVTPEDMTLEEAQTLNLSLNESLRSE